VYYTPGLLEGEGLHYSTVASLPACLPVKIRITFSKNITRRSKEKS
jgi:hypothetical protein